jgi:hypothetical protein
MHNGKKLKDALALKLGSLEAKTTKNHIFVKIIVFSYFWPPVTSISMPDNLFLALTRPLRIFFASGIFKVLRLKFKLL